MCVFLHCARVASLAVDQHIGMLLFALQCFRNEGANGGRWMRKRSGPTAGFTVLHDALVHSQWQVFPCPPPDSSPWSREGHEYSAKCPLFITMQQRSMCALCMWTHSNLSVTAPASAPGQQSPEHWTISSIAHWIMWSIESWRNNGWSKRETHEGSLFVVSSFASGSPVLSVSLRFSVETPPLVHDTGAKMLTMNKLKIKHLDSSRVKQLSFPQHAK